MNYEKLLDKYGIKHRVLQKRLDVAKATFHNIIRGKSTKANSKRLRNEIEILATQLLDELEKRY